MDFNYDILATVIDMNFPTGENLDLPCKNIFSVMAAFIFQKTHRNARRIYYTTVETRL